MSDDRREGEPSGDRGTRIERAFRGITPRLAVRYLEGLGGEVIETEGDLAGPSGEATVEGDDWRVTVSATRASVGPTLTLTEVHVAFEGDPTTLDSLVEAFAKKAMRAGG